MFTTFQKQSKKDESLSTPYDLDKIKDDAQHQSKELNDVGNAFTQCADEMKVLDELQPLFNSHVLQNPDKEFNVEDCPVAVQEKINATSLKEQIPLPLVDGKHPLTNFIYSLVNIFSERMNTYQQKVEGVSGEINRIENSLR